MFATSVFVGMEDQFRPGAVEDVPVGLERVVAGRERRAGRRSGRRASAVRTGTTIPPARCDSASRRRPCPAACLRGSSGSLSSWAARRLAQAAVVSLPAPSISSPISSSVASGPCSPTIPPLVDDENPVGERDDLVELERDEQDGAPFVTFLDQSPVQELDRADVEAARGLGGDQHLRVTRDLARCARPSAGYRPESAPARVSGPAAAHVELPDQRPRALDEPRREEPAPARVRRRSSSRAARCSRRC